MSSKDNKTKPIELGNLRSVDELVELGETLKKIPFWNLYHYLNSGRESLFPQILPLLDETQRRRIFDLENWTKDDFSMDRYEFWLEAVAKSQNMELFQNFVSQVDYKLYLKGKFQISTFDLEFSEYPEHDHFFLTDDNQFLIEYTKDYELAEELRHSLRVFYQEKGVTQAYENLMDLISESFFEMQEGLFLEKRERLQEVGVLDYFDSLKLLQSFPSESKLDKSISQKIHAPLENLYIETTQEMSDTESRMSHFYKEEGSCLIREFNLIKNSIVGKYFNYYLTQLINSVLHLNGKLQGSTSEVRQESQNIKSTLNLSLSYIRKSYDFSSYPESLLEKFSLTEVYNIGINLINLRKKKVKNIYLKYFDESEIYFVGDRFNLFLEDFSVFSKVREKKQLIDIDDVKVLDKLDERLNLLIDLLSLMKNLFIELSKTKDENYLNYEKDEVEFEVLFLGQFVSYCLELSAQGLCPCFSGLEFKDFYYKFQDKEFIQKRVSSFIEFSKLEYISGLNSYIIEILDDHFSEVELSDIKDEGDLKHLSGVLIRV